MTRDWKLLARILAPDIPEETIERVTPSLDAIEASMRAQVDRIPLETEPAYVMLVAQDKQA